MVPTAGVDISEKRKFSFPADRPSKSLVSNPTTFSQLHTLFVRGLNLDYFLCYCKYTKYVAFYRQPSLEANHYTRAQLEGTGAQRFHQSP
jgi:hypothetical protein